jgi:hypothetical protein
MQLLVAFLEGLYGVNPFGLQGHMLKLTVADNGNGASDKQQV